MPQCRTEFCATARYWVCQSVSYGAENELTVEIGQTGVRGHGQADSNCGASVSVRSKISEEDTITHAKNTGSMWADVVKQTPAAGNQSNKNSVNVVSRSFSRNNPVNGTRV